MEDEECTTKIDRFYTMPDYFFKESSRSMKNKFIDKIKIYILTICALIYTIALFSSVFYLCVQFVKRFTSFESDISIVLILFLFTIISIIIGFIFGVL